VGKLSGKSVDEVLELIREAAEKVDDVKIYYALKQMRLKHVVPSTVNFLKFLVAISELGLPITSGLVSHVCNINLNETLRRLHTLGDRHVLILKRQTQKRYEWILTPLFKKLYYGKNSNPPLQKIKQQKI